MARLYHRKARKDYPNNGIAKGQMYYYSKIKTGPRNSRTIRSLTKPRPSQLTASEFLGTIGDIQEIDLPNATDIDALREIRETLEELGGEQREKFDNMPEGLQQGQTGELLEERADGCEEWCSSFDEAIDEYDSEISEIDGMDADDLELVDPDDEELETARDEKRNELFERIKEQCESACPF